MTSSLRGRLLLWYTTMVAVVMLVFGAIVCYLAWRAGLNDLDAALRSRAQTLAGGLRPAGPNTFDLILPPDPSATTDLSYYVVWTPNGALIDTSDVERGHPRDHREGFHTRNGSREFTLHASGAYVLVGQSLDTLWRATGALAVTMTSVGLAALAVSFIGGWFLVTRALVPINRINDTARAMADGDFSARIPVNRVETELWQLARALNDAFDRLHAALERQRRFTADASHELRTPLAVISTEADWAIRRDRRVEEYRHSLEVCQRASHRMQGVVERLLALARADIRSGDIEALPVPLHEVAESALRNVRPLADAKGLTVTFDAAPVSCLGDCDRLLDAITNVVTNAIHYNVPNGRIRVQVGEAGPHAEVIVRDTGIGISDEHLPHIFEPFFRGDPARTRAAGGSGLGLAVADAIVRQHGGAITCDSEIGRGTTVRIRLPHATHGSQPLDGSDSTLRPSVLEQAAPRDESHRSR
jgi:two-component system, OmpR family, sensor kinase